MDKKKNCLGWTAGLVASALLTFAPTQAWCVFPSNSTDTLSGTLIFNVAGATSAGGTASVTPIVVTPGGYWTLGPTQDLPVGPAGQTTPFHFGFSNPEQGTYSVGAVIDISNAFDPVVVTFDLTNPIFGSNPSGGSGLGGGFVHFGPSAATPPVPPGVSAEDGARSQLLLPIFYGFLPEPS